MKQRAFTVPVVAVSIVCGVVVSSCAGPSESEGPAVTVTDSAGIEIVTSAVPAWQSGGGWSISEAPTLEIGTASGDEAYSLYRVGGVIRLPGERIAVANGGTWQIRIYDEHGVHQQNVGRNGDGPGEFRSLRELWLSRGDSMMTADVRLNRITLFDSEGRVGRTIQIGPSGEVVQVFGREPFDDGTILVSGRISSTQRPRQGLFDGGSRVFDRYSPDGSPLNRIGEYPQGPNWGYTIQGSQAYRAAPFSVSSPPNASDGVAVYLGTGTRFQVEKRSTDGALLRLIRWDAEPRAVTSDIVDRYRRTRLETANTPELRDLAEAGLDGIIFPEQLAAYQSVLVDTEDHLWVEQYRARWETERRWWVFDPTGRWLGEPPIPTGAALAAPRTLA